MREQPASVINTRQTFSHISVLDPGLGKDEGTSYMRRALKPLTQGISSES